MNQNKRTKRVQIRLTDEEYKMLMDRKTKARLAEWVRDLALGQKPMKQPKLVDQKLLFQLNRIGVNLNQIAKQCNQTKPNIDLINVGLSLREIEKLLQGLADDS